MLIAHHISKIALKESKKATFIFYKNMISYLRSHLMISLQGYTVNGEF